MPGLKQNNRDLRKHLIRQIDQMVQVMIQVAKGNHAAQIPISGQYDEIDALAMGINMLIDNFTDEIEERKQIENKLKELSNKLEHLVKERTADLTLMNEALHREIEEHTRAEQELRKQQRFADLRTRMWKLATDKSLSEKALIQSLCNTIGPALKVTRVCFNRITEKKHITCAIEWCKKGFKATLGASVPKFVWKRYQDSAYTLFTPKTIKKLPLKSRMITTAIMKSHRLRALIALPITIENRVDGFISADECEIHGREWQPHEIAILRDLVNITSQSIYQKRMELQLRVNEEKYRSMFENIQDIYYETTLDGTVLELSPSFETLSKYKRSELLGKSIRRMYPRPEKRKNLIEQLIKHGKVEDYEVEMKRKDNVIVPCAVTTKLIKDKNGRPLKMIGTLRTITERKKTAALLQKAKEELGQRVAERTAKLAEINKRLNLELAERRRAENELRESEEKFRNLAEQSPNMIFINFRGRVVYANRECEKVMGYKRSEFYSPKFNFLKLIAPDYRELIQYNLKKRFSGKDILPYEYQLITKKGKRLNSIITSKLIRYEGGTAILGIVTDISTQKQTEEALARAKANLEKQNLELMKIDKIKDTLIRDVAHELKTPVAKHAMQLDLLKETLPPQPLTQTIFKVMNTSLRRQEHVIRNILDLSRLEAGGRRYKRKPVRVNEIIHRVIKDYATLFESYKIQVQTEISKFTIQSDREMLGHVFSNIINNAVKYRTKKKKPFIHIWGRKNKKGMHIKFTDNGIGLSKIETRKAFDRFYQSSPSSEGSGVGLSICKRIVEDLGGRIWLESPGRDKGATVYIELT